MLISEELALVAVDPDSGRHGLGKRSQLNACLGGLLVAELLLEGHAEQGKNDDEIVLTGTTPDAPTLAAAAKVVKDKGPKVKRILSAMDRGLEDVLDAGTWDASVAGLVATGALSEAEGTIRPKRRLLDRAARDEIVARLQAAATSDEPLEPRTALLLSMTGPADLLEVVAPERSGRRHARERIDHALDATELKAVGKIVRKLIEEAEAAAATAAIVAGSGS